MRAFLFITIFMLSVFITEAQPILRQFGTTNSPSALTNAIGNIATNTILPANNVFSGSSNSIIGEFGVYDDANFFGNSVYVHTNLILTAAGVVRSGHGRISSATESIYGFDSIESDGPLIASTYTYSTNGFVAPISLLTRSLDLTAQTNVYEDIVFSPSTINPVGIVDAATLVSTSGPSADQMALVFEANNLVLVPAQMSHTWIAGTTIYPHMHFVPLTDGNITNTWQISYSVADVNGAFPSSTVVTNQIWIASGNQWKNHIVALPTNGISMSGKTGPSTIIRLRYLLLSTTEDMHLVSFDVHYRWGGSPVIFNP